MKLPVKYSAIPAICENLEKYGDKYKKLIDDMLWRIQYYNSDNQYIIDCDKYNIEELKVIKDALRAIRARTLVKKLDSVISVLEDPDTVEVSTLEAFPRIIKEYMDKKAPHRWVFIEEDGYGNNSLIPYFVHNVYYEPEHFDQKGYFEEAYCSMEIHTNSIEGYNKKKVYFRNENINGRTINEVLRDKNIFIENDQLYNDYVKSNEKYVKRLNEKGKQYAVTQYISGVGSFWRSRKIVDPEDAAMKFFHVVNDFKGDKRNLVKSESCSFWGNEFDSWGDRKSKAFEVPVLPYIPCYNLDTYCDCFCHVDDIKDYEYDHSLKDKLVLPKSHKALLDILINNSSILKGDIINNKGNGTVVILEGPPGCGKTLTTEVYSELVEKPLYKISSGQLGVDAKDMDKNLNEVLNRASRLDCILLIDECETFVKRRGDDLIQNAIITTFLRKIEYFDGIMFLTSNKIKDIDEAILSRCIAAIKYEPPIEENAKKIWRVLSDQFELSDQVTDDMINILVKVFPNAVGRDIKELLKLTARYCQGTNQKMNIKAFIECSQFRYIDTDEEYCESLNLDDL